MTEFQFRTNEETGDVCCSSTNAAGQPIAPLHPCEKCEAHFAAQGLRLGEHTDDSYPAPNGYARGLAQLRVANEHRTSTFEKQYMAERKAAFAAEYANNAAHGEARFATLSADELSKFKPPNSYESGLQALRAKDKK